jgi:chemotaxis protein CheD
MAEMAVARSPSILRITALGSCVAIMLYDCIQKIGGLGHIALPCPVIMDNTTNKAKFATTAVHELVSQMEQMGAEREHIIAKIAGGADMFPEIIPSDSPMDVGTRNIMAVREELEGYDIEIIAEELGDHIGRTVSFNTEDGSVAVKTANSEERVY